MGPLAQRSFQKSRLLHRCFGAQWILNETGAFASSWTRAWLGVELQTFELIHQATTSWASGARRTVDAIHSRSHRSPPRYIHNTALRSYTKIGFYPLFLRHRHLQSYAFIVFLRFHIDLTL